MSWGDCPYCGKPALSFWRRAWFAWQAPYCEHCGERFVFSWPVHMALDAALALFVMGGWLAVAVGFDWLGFPPWLYVPLTLVAVFGGVYWARRRYGRLRRRDV